MKELYWTLIVWGGGEKVTRYNVKGSFSEVTKRALDWAEMKVNLVEALKIIRQDGEISIGEMVYNEI